MGLKGLVIGITLVSTLDPNPSFSFSNVKSYTKAYTDTNTEGYINNYTEGYTDIYTEAYSDDQIGITEQSLMPSMSKERGEYRRPRGNLQTHLEPGSIKYM